MVARCPSPSVLKVASMKGIRASMWNDSHWREPSFQSEYQPASAFRPPSGMTMIKGNAAEKSMTSVFCDQVSYVSPAPCSR